MKVLLTGATGFLGSRLLRRLVSGGYTVVVLKRSSSDLRAIQENLTAVKLYDLDLDLLETVFLEHKIDGVIHAATTYGRHVENIDIVEFNLVFPLRLMSLATDAGVDFFLNIDTLLDKYVNPYALSKRQFRDWLEFSSNNVAMINVAFDYLYGPNGSQDSLVSYLIRGLLEKREVVELTLGYQYRDFLHVDDAVSGLMTVIERGKQTSGFQSYELGSGVPVRVRDFCSLVAKLSGNAATLLKYGALPYRENEVMEQVVNLENIRKLGWIPEISLEAGITHLIQSWGKGE